MTTTSAAVLPVRPDTYLATVAVNGIGLPQRIAEVFALRLGRRHPDDVEVLTESATWRTVRPGQELRVETNRMMALKAWDGFGRGSEQMQISKAGNEDCAS